MKKEQIISIITNKESRCAVLEENGKVLNYSKQGGYMLEKIYMTTIEMN